MFDALWERIRMGAAAKLPTLLLPLTMFCFAASFAQIHIHEKVDITKQTPGTLMKPGQPPAVVSGFVIPKGLRNRLQVYYGALERLDEEIPWYAKLKTIRSDTLGSDTTLYDMATESRFPNVLPNPETFTDWCGWWGEFHYKYYSTPSAATELYDVMRVVPRDTVVLGYITQIVGEGRTDTLGIFTADTVKLFADSTIVGWNVSFADYNNCLDTWNEKMDVFVALNCPNYPKFAQGDTAVWANDNYDSYVDSVTSQGDTVYFKMKRKACALSSVAMILNGLGLESITPGTLNRLPNQISSSSGGIIWGAMDRVPGNNTIMFWKMIGNGLFSAHPTNVILSSLDVYLEKCQPILAEVNHRYNQKDHQHWVLITGKNAQGQYLINDPGTVSNTTLDAYQNIVGRAAIYKRKPS